MLDSEAQKERPLYDHLQRHSERDSRRYHIPGHAGCNYDSALWREIASWDVTEVLGMDDLHAPTSVIAEAQQLAAQAFGAARTFFLVNGTSVGIVATLSALFSAGDQLIIQRNAHKSVHNAIAMRQLHPLYLQPEILLEGGMAGVVCANDLQKLLEGNPTVKGVVLTNPTFYGHIADIKSLAAVCHAKSVILIVDEAHGAHWSFADDLKKCCGIRAGADIVIQSAHKTLPALTQASLLHVSERAMVRIDIYNLQWWLSSYQTTSPSYLLMASLDYARHWMVEHGAGALDNAKLRKKMLQESLKESANLQAFDLKWQAEQRPIDTLKLTLPIPRAFGSSKKLEELLATKDIYVELTGFNHILLVLPLLRKAEQLEDPRQILVYDEKLVYELAALVEREDGPERAMVMWPQQVPELVILPGELLANRDTTLQKNIKLEDALGQVVAEYVIPYPPGIPLLCPGERISKQALDYVRNAREEKVHFQGMSDPSLSTIRCLM